MAGNTLGQNWKIVKNLWDTFGNNPDNQRTVDAMKGMLGLLPASAGDVVSGLLAADDVRRGDYTSAALNGVGVLPFIPSMAGIIKGVGNPTVYHGTNAVFDKFRTGADGGIYFTDIPDRAAGIGRNLIPAKLKMNNPLDLRGQDSFTSDLVTKYDNDLFLAKSAGYDGVIDGDTYIVFDPSQVERLDKANIRQPTKYEQAHEVARQNAVKMLGLPENNTVMDRAKALGFDTDAYHASDKSFDAFDPAKVATNDYGAIGQGVYVDLDENAPYANSIISLLGNKEGSNVMPLKVRSGNAFNADELPAIYSAERSKAVTEGLKSQGFDSVKAYADGKPNEMVVFDPSRIRSRFAAFDPARINEPDLLGRVNPELLPWLTGAGLLGAGGMYYSGE